MNERWRAVLTGVLLSLVFFPGICRAVDSRLELGVAEYRQENFEEAVVLLQSAWKEAPDSSLTAFYLGMALKQTGDYRAAEEFLKKSVTLSPPVLDSYLELADLLYTLGDLDGALQYLNRAGKSGVKPASVSFLKGLVLAQKGETEEAIDALDEAKRRDGALAQQVELQEAIIMAKARRLRQARDSLKALIALDPTSEAASLAREYESSFSRIIGSHRWWRLGAGLAYQYDDNVISKPIAANILPTDVRDQADQDSAFVGSFRLELSPLVDHPWGITAQYQLQTTTYGSIDTHNTILHNLTLIPSYSGGFGAVSVPLSYAHAMLAEEGYLDLYTVRPTASFLVGNGQIVQLTAGYSRREMLRQPLAPEEDRDGSIYAVGAGYVIPFAEGKGMVNLRYEFAYDDAKGDNWVNRGHRLTIGTTMPLMDGVSLQVSGDVSFQDYPALRTDPTLNVPLRRDDTIYTAQFGATWELNHFLTLLFQYGHTRADSNMPLYDYRRNVVTAGIDVTF